jgi:hypothetical protein
MDAFATPFIPGRHLSGLTAEHAGDSVTRLGLSTRSLRCIGAEVNVAELLGTVEVELMRRRHFGRACLADVRKRLTLFALDAFSVPDHDPRRALLGAGDPSLAAGLDAPAQARTFGEVLEELLELLDRQAAAGGASANRRGRKPGRPQRATLADIAELLYGCLTARERQVTEAMYSGGGDAALPSLADLGREIGLSRERVRQLAVAARGRLDTDAERRRRAWLTQELLAAFEGAGGVLSQRQVCDALRRKHRGPQAVASPLARLLLEVTPDCCQVRGVVWCAGVERERVAATLERLHGLLRRNARIMAMNQLAAALRQRAGFRATPEGLIGGCVAADSRFREFDGRRIGLREWEWGIPRTLDELVIACLRSSGRPLSTAEATAAVQGVLPPGKSVASAAVQSVLDGPDCVAMGGGLYVALSVR